MPASDTKARFVEPMLLLRSETLPEGSKRTYQWKLDGFRALAIKSNSEASSRLEETKKAISAISNERTCES